MVEDGGGVKMVMQELVVYMKYWWVEPVFLLCYTMVVAMVQGVGWRWG